MRIYSERQSEAASLQRFREEEVYGKIAELPVLRKELSVINEKELKARFRGDKDQVSALRAEREQLFETKKELLRAYGYPDDYLELPCTCLLCRDKGTLPGGEKCACMKQLEAELVNEQSGLPGFLGEVSFEDIDTGLYNDEAPMADLPAKSRKYTQREYMEKIIFPKVRMFLDTFDGPGPHNLYMTGAAGTGKTYLSACIAKSLMASLHSVIYVSAGELSGLYSRVEFGRGDSESMESRLSLIEECDLLIIDDLGTEFTREVTKAELFSLISRRLSAGKSTIITSNKDLNEIEAVYGDRVASRIKGSYLILQFFGTDLRLAKRLRDSQNLKNS